MDRPGHVSANIEKYLEWIYRLSKENERVTTTHLARELRISPASVTGMLKRLAERGFIAYKPYHGITLTSSGREVGAAIIRRHGLIERLLTDVLGIPWHRADEEASRLEHAITPEVEERLAAFLGYPETCPHGQPLDWEKTASSVRLSVLQDGDRAIISRIGDEQAEFLEYVKDLGLLPEVRVEIVRRAPFNGPLIIRVNDREHAIGDKVADRIWVHRLDAEENGSDSVDEVAAA